MIYHISYCSHNNIVIRFRFMLLVTTLLCLIVGVKLQELTSANLPETTGHISIRGDELAVPGWGGNMFRLFRLNR